MAKCQRCKERQAIWAMQFVAEETPTFYILGSHVRGFPVIKVCDGCRNDAAASVMNTKVPPEIAALDSF